MYLFSPFESSFLCFATKSSSHNLFLVSIPFINDITMSIVSMSFNTIFLLSCNILIVIPIFCTFFYTDSTESTLLYRLLISPIYNFSLELFNEYVSESRRYLFPYIFFLFFILVISNIIGVLPLNFAMSSHLSMTFYLAFITWFTSATLSLVYCRNHFFSHFLVSGIPNALVPFLFIIEVISFVIKVVSLSLRLFANIFAGHILLHVISSGLSMNGLFIGYACMFTSIISISILATTFAVLLFFEILVGILQAYIFVLLSLIYLSDV